jgi:acylphosphatase
MKHSSGFALASHFFILHPSSFILPPSSFRRYTGRIGEAEMEPNEEAERREIHYSGRVQGVGFRYTVRAIARQFAVKGYVKNLADGRVELVVEGRAEEIRAMLLAIRAEMGRHIRDVCETPSRATGGFSGFEVRF